MFLVSVVISVIKGRWELCDVVRIGKCEVQALYYKLGGAVVLIEEACPSPADVVLM